jgi:hypothetical protein
MNWNGENPPCGLGGCRVCGRLLDLWIGEVEGRTPGLVGGGGGGGE